MTNVCYTAQVEINVVNHKGDEFTPSSDRNMLRGAAMVYVRELNLHQHDVIYTITVSQHPDDAGYCSAQWDEDFEVWQVEIEIPPGDCEHMLTVLAHEMVHAKQYVTGELVSTVIQKNQKPVTEHVWHGETYTDVSYHHAPWEIQAYEMEKQLLKKVM